MAQPMQGDPVLAYVFEMEDIDGRRGFVTYLVPADVTVYDETDAGDNSIVTRWDYNDGTPSVLRPRAWIAQ